MPSWLSQLCTCGTSRWQCGHQWATNMTTLGLPSFVMAIGLPAKSMPVRAGGTWPTALSSSAPSQLGSGSPLTDTSPVSCVPSATTVPPEPDESPVTVVSSDDELPTAMATTSASTTTSTTPPMIHNARLPPP